VDWDPEVRAKLKKLKKLRELRELKELKEEVSPREQQQAIALRTSYQSMTPDIKMVVGDWYTDDLGNHARLIYNAKHLTSIHPTSHCAVFSQRKSARQRRVAPKRKAPARRGPGRSLADRPAYSGRVLSGCQQESERAIFVSVYDDARPYQRQ
jgi:hypothetical protein